MTAAASKTPILVVDDETPRVLRTSLALEGYHVLEAGNGAGAIDMIGREKPEVVILDLRLRDSMALMSSAAFAPAVQKYRLLCFQAGEVSAQRLKPSLSARMIM